ncbi:hypothetical protein M5689_003998 [Euphorbia peplus]|nr:hypothetical protein M5689_003998 [Euphorbia peplus]
MAHSLAAAAAAIPITTKSTPSQPFPKIPLSKTDHSQTNILHRRTVTLGLAGALLGLNAGCQSANAAKRPPPPPPREKNDPNVSGVLAKVLASKKRKEALKESVAKLREKGKPITE